MDYRNLLTLALVAVLLAPVASAYAPNADSAPDQGEATADAGVADEAADAAADAQDDSNYTRLYIADGYHSDRVKPGETASFNVTVGNAETHEVELDPHVVLPQVQGRPIQESWITIEDADTTLGPDEERTFTVTVDVPDDAELASYRAQVAFTNQTVSYEGRPDQPVHSARISVNVYEEPSVEISGDTYRYAQIQTGESYTYEYEIENTGDEAVPVNPEIAMQNTRMVSSTDQNTVDRSWFSIEAPNEVAPGETETVTITVEPPEDADLGRYRTEVNLGLKDPNRPDRSDYWQQVSLNFQVWEQPDEPFETTFSVSEDADNVTLTLSGGNYRDTASDDPVSFDVTFVSPSGEEIDPQRVSVSDGGSVSLAGDDGRQTESDGPYASESTGTEFEYRVDDPESGEWTAQITPQNTINFRYEIVRNESGD